MKALLGVLFVLLVGLNVWQLSDRQRLRDLIETSREQARVQVETVSAPLRKQITKLKAQKQALAEQVTALEEATLVSAEVPGSSNINPAQGLVEVLENPAMKEVMAAQQKATLDAQYQRLYERLSLEGEELEHFQTLITESQMVIMENRMKMMSGDLSAEERQELAETLAASKKNLDGRVKEFLNDDADYEYYVFYTDTLGERLAMNGLQSTLQSDPLDADTEEALVKLMVDERQAIGFEDQYYDQNQFDPSTMTQAKIDRFMSQYDELQNNLATRAGSLLNAAQLEAFNANQKTSRSMQEMGLGMIYNMVHKE